jgi:hypothetical protein
LFLAGLLNDNGEIWIEQTISQKNDVILSAFVTKVLSSSAQKSHTRAKFLMDSKSFVDITVTDGERTTWMNGSRTDDGIDEAAIFPSQSSTILVY